MTERASRRLAPLLLAAAVICAFHRTIAAADLPRVRVLLLADRASLVIEADGPLENVAETRSDCPTGSECLVAEAGPIAKSDGTLDLVAPASSRIIERVSLQPFTRSDGRTFVRVRVHLRDRGSHALRLAGNRLYIDFAPTARSRSAARSEPIVANAVREPSRPAAAQRADQGQGRSDQGRRTTSPWRGVEAEAGEIKTQPEGRRAEAQDYETFKADVLRRAQQRARQPDVKGLLALVAEVRRKDEQLGHQRPDLITELLDEVNRLLDEARVLQLEADREAFRKDGGKKK